jgi:hypothetical protein
VVRTDHQMALSANTPATLQGQTTPALSVGPYRPAHR